LELNQRGISTKIGASWTHKQAIRRLRRAPDSIVTASIMDCIAKILNGMAPDRQETFREWLELSDPNHGEDITKEDAIDQGRTD
jgi:hypothetical protein